MTSWPLLLCFTYMQLRIVPPSIRVGTNGVMTAEVTSASPGSPPFELSLAALSTGTVRMRILEKNDLPPRWEVSA